MIDMVSLCRQNALGEYLEDAYRFDAQTESWEQIDDFPGGPRGYAYGVSNNTTAYVGFGKFNSDYPTDWWAYDIPIINGHNWLIFHLQEEVTQH